MPRGHRLAAGPLSRAIAEILSSEVIAQGISQRAYGEMVDVSQGQISQYLRGERALLVDELELFCTALGLDVGDVVAAAVKARPAHL